MRDLLRVAGTAPAFVILNGLHPQATKQAEDTKVLIEDIYGFPVCPVHLCTRGTYAAAPAMGKAPQEYEPDGKAAEEVARLYTFIIHQLNMSTSQHEQPTESLATGT